MQFEAPEVNAALQQFSDDLADEHPEIGEVLKKLRDGELDTNTAMAQLMSLVHEKGLGDDIQRVAEGAFAVLREDTDLKAQLEASPGTSLDTFQNGPMPTVLYPTRPDRLPRLNPLYEAAIAERVQFDGDVPELRTGPMPDGSAPAVPVHTTARNPVAIGRMLEDASEAVQSELNRAHGDWGDQAEQLTAEARALGMDKETALAHVTSQLPAPPAGVPGYEPGKLPALREVKTPTGSALAAMPVEEQQAAAYRTLSTGQGRRSALRVIEELVLVGLESEGFPMEARAPTRGQEVLAYAEWTADIYGAESTQSNFSFIDVASKVLIIKLRNKLRETPVPNPVLEVLAVDTVDVRRVGWAARVVSL